MRSTAKIALHRTRQCSALSDLILARARSETHQPQLHRAIRTNTRSNALEVGARQGTAKRGKRQHHHQPVVVAVGVAVGVAMGVAVHVAVAVGSARQ